MNWTKRGYKTRTKLTRVCLSVMNVENQDICSRAEAKNSMFTAREYLEYQHYSRTIKQTLLYLNPTHDCVHYQDCTFMLECVFLQLFSMRKTDLISPASRRGVMEYASVSLKEKKNPELYQLRSYQNTSHRNKEMHSNLQRWKILTRVRMILTVVFRLVFILILKNKSRWDQTPLNQIIRPQ